MIGAEIRLKFEVCGNAGCLIWYVWRRWYIGIAINCRVPMYSSFWYIGIWYSCWIPMYLEYIVLEYTSEMPPFRAFPMYYCPGFSRRYIGIKISMTIPMYGSPNQSNNTSGWANIDYFRCIAKYHHSEIHRNPAIHSHPDVSHLISREYTYISSQYIPARAGKTNKIHRNPAIHSHPDVSHLISRDSTRFPSQ